ncbi:MAG TPA: hypothetical protein VGN46_01225 [Luteibacter sp.]|jgi:hypothetical protein|uniref:hypothetical protein n=1 Tax=Luteibacter sp. TaxID=1886636 RepID=UPI002F3EDF19
MKTKLLAFGLALSAPLSAFAGAPPTINVHFVLHEDVQMNVQDFVSEHVSAWLGHMRADVLPGQDIQIHVHRQLDGLERLPYGHEGALGDWRRAAQPVLDRLGSRDTRATRMVLVVQGSPNGSALGVAYEGTPFAMASVRTSSNVAHELGHTFGAIHEYAETWTTCNTNMGDFQFGLWPCEVYSVRNQQRIRDYVETGRL